MVLYSVYPLIIALRPLLLDSSSLALRLTRFQDSLENKQLKHVYHKILILLKELLSVLAETALKLSRVASVKAFHIIVFLYQIMYNLKGLLESPPQ